jgi:hypothetical protein
VQPRSSASRVATCPVQGVAWSSRCQPETTEWSMTKVRPPERDGRQGVPS